MKKRKSVAKNLIVYAVRTFVLSASPLIIFPYVSRVLGVDGVGEVQYAYSIACYFQLLSGLGVSSYGIREGTKYNQNKQLLGKFCTEMLIINTISSIFSTFIYFGVVFSVNSLVAYRKYLILFGTYVFFAGYTLDWFTSVKEEFTYVTVRTCIVQIIVLLIAFFCIKNKEDTLIYGMVLIIPLVFTSIANGMYIYRNVPLFARKNYEIKKHIFSIVFLFAIIVSANVYSLLDTTMLGIMSGDAEVGLYTAASKYTRLVVQLVLSLCTVFLPRLMYYITSKQQDLFEDLFRKSTKLIFWFIFPCAVGMFVLSPEIIYAFNGEAFSGSISTMKILAINTIFSTIDGFLGWQILVPLKRENFLMIATTTGSVMDVILNIVLIPKFGVNGAAVATLLSEICVFLICVGTCYKYVPLIDIYKGVWQYVLAALSSVLVCRHIIAYLNISGNWSVIIYTVIGTVILYSLILYVIGEYLTRGVINKGIKYFVSKRKQL